MKLNNWFVIQIIKQLYNENNYNNYFTLWATFKNNVQWKPAYTSNLLASSMSNLSNPALSSSEQELELEVY